MSTSERQLQNTVQIYFRDHRKMAKKVRLESHIQVPQLYQLASSNYQLNADSIHLYLGGILIKGEGEVQLQQNSIVHVVDLEHLKLLECIVVNVQQLGKPPSKKFQIRNDLSIEVFLDREIFEEFGINSKQCYLINMGRQLQNQMSFKELQIQSESELICLEVDSFQEPQNKAIQSIQPIKKMNTYSYSQNDNSMNINIRESDHLRRNKDIYPMPNFTIDFPKGVDTSNQLNLIFDSKVRKASSIMDIDFSPEDIIEQEQDGDGNMSCKSEHQSQPHRHKAPSEHSNKSEGVRTYGFDNKIILQKNMSGVENSRQNKLTPGDLIFVSETKQTDGRGMMKELVNELQKQGEVEEDFIDN